MNPEQPKVYLVDDDEDVRDALRLSLKMAGLAVIGYASARAFLDAYQPDQPGCLVLDILMPGMSGLELQARLTAQHIRIPIIFITGHGDVPLSVKAIKGGAIDFLQKPFQLHVLVERIHEAIVLDAQRRAEQAERTTVLDRFASLTHREQEVMAVVAAGKSNKEIARQLQISPRTVEVHRARVMVKMEADSLPDLVTMAATCGVVDLAGVH